MKNLYMNHSVSNCYLENNANCPKFLLISARTCLHEESQSLHKNVCSEGIISSSPCWVQFSLTHRFDWWGHIKLLFVFASRGSHGPSPYTSEQWVFSRHMRQELGHNDWKAGLWSLPWLQDHGPASHTLGGPSLSKQEPMDKAHHLMCRTHRRRQA